MIRPCRKSVILDGFSIQLLNTNRKLFKVQTHNQLIFSFILLKIIKYLKVDILGINF